MERISTIGKCVFSSLKLVLYREVVWRVAPFKGGSSVPKFADLLTATMDMCESDEVNDMLMTAIQTSWRQYLTPYSPYHLHSIPVSFKAYPYENSMAVTRLQQGGVTRLPTSKML